MFSSTGLFKSIPCPQLSKCSVINCIFSHQPEESLNSGTSSSVEKSFKENGIAAPPPSKKRRIEPEQDARPWSALHEERIQMKAQVSQSATVDPGDANLKSPQQISDQVRRPADTTLKSKLRGISPPPRREVKVGEHLSGSKPKVKLDQTRSPVSKVTTFNESLNPRMVTRPPQTHAKRKAMLTALHGAMKLLNDQVSREGDTNSKIALSDAELVSMANDEEEQLALSSPNEDAYRTLAGQRVMKIRRMKAPEWNTLLLKKHKHAFVPPDTTLKESETDSTTTALTLREQISVLHRLRTPLEGLEEYGYVIKRPSELEISSARKGIEMAAGFEVCDRCSSRFQVFPGRDEQGRLTTRGPCRYHWAKISRAPRQKTDAITGGVDAVYACCQNSSGSVGCTAAKSHVFKVTDVKRLASILQFEHTPSPAEKRRRIPLAIDCEMGYTTLGMELIRLTVLSWPRGQEMLDVLVRPMGEILDLNTRWSGVTGDQFTTAIPFVTELVDSGISTSEDGKLEPQPLRKVSSPAEARKLLFGLLSPDTPLIGHAIENDLNTCRVIHPWVIDTVLLFPHPRGLPIRYGLQMLASKYLGEHIQQGGARGHDSKEDAKATGDLVRFKVEEKWKQMRRDGWTFQEGGLTPPVDDLTEKGEGADSPRILNAL